MRLIYRLNSQNSIAQKYSVRFVIGHLSHEGMADASKSQVSLVKSLQSSRLTCEIASKTKGVFVCSKSGLQFLSAYA